MPSDELKTIVQLALNGSDDLFSPHCLQDHHYSSRAADDAIAQGKQANGIFLYSGDFQDATDLAGLNFGKRKPNPINPSAPDANGFSAKPTRARVMQFRAESDAQAAKDSKILTRRNLVPIDPNASSKNADNLQEWSVVGADERKSLIRSFLLQRKKDFQERSVGGALQIRGLIPYGYMGFLRAAHVKYNGSDWQQAHEMTVVVGRQRGSFQVITLFPV